MTIEDYSPLFATIRHYSPLFATIRHYSPLFATISTVRTIRYSLFAIRGYSLFAIRYSRLFAIRYSGFADTQKLSLDNSVAKGQGKGTHERKQTKFFTTRGLFSTPFNII